jgi:hypothetical protein
MSKQNPENFVSMLHVSDFVLRLARVESVSPNSAIFCRQDMVPELQDFDLELDTSVSHGFPFSWCIPLHWV